jgi:hypothetical protein
MEWIEVGQVAKQCNCYSGYDEELECHILDEDKVNVNTEFIFLSVCVKLS